MAYKVYLQGETHILNNYFNATDFTGPFYIGLASGPIPQLETATLADVDEIFGFGYKRIAVNRDDSPYGWSISDDTAKAAEVSWFNSDVSTSWKPADYAFLTLSAYGQDEPNILIAAVDLENTVILAPQKKFKLLFKFRQI